MLSSFSAYSLLPGAQQPCRWGMSRLAAWRTRRKLAESELATGNCKTPSRQFAERGTKIMNHGKRH